MGATAALAFAAGALAGGGLLMLAPDAAGRRRAPAPVVRLLARLGRRAGGARVPAALERRIAAAGLRALGARELMAAKAASAAIGALAGVALGAVAPGRLGLLLAAGGPAAGFLAPDWWLARRAAARAREARRELPALLDLLRVTVAAGLSPPAALAAVGERGRGPLAREWRTVGREVALGVPLAGALDGMAARLPLPEVEALAATLRRAARHGAPLAETVAAQAREARLARRRRIQEDAARAGPKIQLVVAMLLVPSVLLLVAAALAAALLGGGAADGLGVAA
jgi:tight adherence protein C